VLRRTPVYMLRERLARTGSWGESCSWRQGMLDLEKGGPDEGFAGV
jgi:hypothetical protein